MKYLKLFVIVFLIVQLLYFILTFFLPKTGVSFVENKTNYFYEKYHFSSLFGISKIKAKQTKKVQKDTQKLNGVTLKATFVNDEKSFVTLEKNRKITFVELGKQFNGYELIEVLETEAIFKKYGKHYNLTMNKKKINNYSVSEEVIQLDESNFKVSKEQINTYTKDFKSIWQDVGINTNIVNNKIDGFKVTKVRPYSQIEKIGIQKGDIIKAVNNRPLKSNQDAFAVYKNIKNLDSLKLTIIRDGQIKDIEYEIY